MHFDLLSIRLFVPSECSLRTCPGEILFPPSSTSSNVVSCNRRNDSIFGDRCSISSPILYTVFSQTHETHPGRFNSVVVTSISENDGQERERKSRTAMSRLIDVCTCEPPQSIHILSLSYTYINKTESSHRDSTVPHRDCRQPRRQLSRHE